MMSLSKNSQRTKSKTHGALHYNISLNQYEMAIIQTSLYSFVSGNFRNILKDTESHCGHSYSDQLLLWMGKLGLACCLFSGPLFRNVQKPPTSYGLVAYLHFTS